MAKQKVATFWQIFFRSKKLASTRSVFTLTPPLGFPNLSRKPTTKKAPATKQVAVYHPYEMSLIQEGYDGFPGHIGDSSTFPGNIRDLSAICIRTLPKKRSNNEWFIFSQPFWEILPRQPAVTASFFELLLDCLVNFETSFGVGWLTSPCQKKVFLTLNSGLQSTCLTGRLLREMDPIWTACRSEHWPVLNEIWKVETCFFSPKFGLKRIY